eukprot:1455439-Rhodomonas_salina.1
MSRGLLPAGVALLVAALTLCGPRAPAPLAPDAADRARTKHAAHCTLHTALPLPLSPLSNSLART